MTNTSGVTDTVSFNWDTPGLKTITVTAANAGEVEVSDTHTMLIRVPLDGMTLSGPSAGVTGTLYIFTATVSPVTATQPITYAWQATGQSPMTNASRVTDMVSFSWNTPGLKTITVTATNSGGVEVSDPYSIVIDNDRKIYLPLILAAP